MRPSLILNSENGAVCRLKGDRNLAAATGIGTLSAIDGVLVERDEVVGFWLGEIGIRHSLLLSSRSLLLTTLPAADLPSADSAFAPHVGALADDCQNAVLQRFSQLLRQVPDDVVVLPGVETGGRTCSEARANQAPYCVDKRARS